MEAFACSLSPQIIDSVYCIRSQAIACRTSEEFVVFTNILYPIHPEKLHQEFFFRRNISQIVTGQKIEQQTPIHVKNKYFNETTSTKQRDKRKEMTGIRKGKAGKMSQPMKGKFGGWKDQKPLGRFAKNV
ncbi:MAG: hypothetical protein AAFV95_22325 [Bacteroidota bacterium]